MWNYPSGIEGRGLEMFVVTVTLKNTKNNCIWTDDMWGWFELVHLGEK